MSSADAARCPDKCESRAAEKRKKMQVLAHMWNGSGKYESISGMGLFSRLMFVLHRNLERENLLVKRVSLEVNDAYLYSVDAVL